MNWLCFEQKLCRNCVENHGSWGYNFGMKIFGLKITEDKELECSLCYKKESEVEKMLAGPAEGKEFKICNECIEIAADIIDYKPK